MSLQVEKMEKNMAKLTIEVSAEDLDKAMQNAYQKAKGRISIPGFRKGKAPRKMIEQMYGKGVFLEDAVNALIPEHYSKALAECELEIVSQPTIDITQAEPGKAFIFTAEVAVKPEVTLGDYKGVEVPKTEITVTDEDVEAELKKEQEKNSRTIILCHIKSCAVVCNRSTENRNRRCCRVCSLKSRSTVTENKVII